MSIFDPALRNALRTLKLSGTLDTLDTLDARFGPHPRWSAGTSGIPARTVRRRDRPPRIRRPDKTIAPREARRTSHLRGVSSVVGHRPKERIRDANTSLYLKAVADSLLDV